MNMASKSFFFGSLILILLGCVSVKPYSKDLPVLVTSLPPGISTSSPTSTPFPILPLQTSTPESVFTRIETTTSALAVQQLLTKTAALTPFKTYTSVPIYTPTQVETPVPTFTIGQRKDYLFSLLRNNAGCRFPCWWGIIPGKTTWEEVKNMFITIGGRTGRTGDLRWGDFGNLFLDIYYDFGFYEQDDIVQSIVVQSQGYSDPSTFTYYWKNIFPEYILSTYGQPSSVKVAISGSETGELFYYLDIYYENLGFVMSYRGLASNITGSNPPKYRFCPAWTSGTWLPHIKISLQSPDSPTPLSELGDYSYPNRTLEKTTGLGIEDFYQRFLPGNGPACFETPAALWP